MSPHSVTLNDGNTMPQLGLGVFKVNDTQTATTVRLAHDLGYRLVDTAAIYGNEAGVGDALKTLDMFVTTKLWNDRHDDPEAALDESLALLGLDTVDLYLIHWPVPAQGKSVEAWKALVRLRDAGKARSIGVSNFLPEHLDAIIDASGVVPAVNQIELHPSFQQREQRAYHEQHGIVTQSWSPLGRGAVLALPELVAIADKHGRSVAQVVLRWHLDRGLTVIPKASDEAHLADNLAATEFTLDEEDLAAIDALDRPDGRTGPDPRVL